MENIYLLLLVCLFLWYLYAIRNISDKAAIYAQQYCEKNGLQFIALARLKSRFRFNKRNGLYIASSFALEFSSNGEDSYTGEVELNGIKLKNVSIPPYRIN